MRKFEFGNAHTNASLPAQPAQRGVQVDTEVRARGSGSRRQRSDHQRAADGQSSEPVPHQVPQPAADPVPDHGIADRLTHDKTHPGRLLPIPGGRDPVRFSWVGNGRHQGVHHQPGPTSTTSPANHRPELLATGEPGGRGEHGFAEWIRRTAQRGPCAGGQQEWPDRHGCACADGNRASSPDDGCWAGRCACPCSRSSLPASDTKWCRSYSVSGPLGDRCRIGMPISPAASGDTYEGTHSLPASPNRG